MVAWRGNAQLQPRPASCARAQAADWKHVNPTTGPRQIDEVIGPATITNNIRTWVVDSAKPYNIGDTQFDRPGGTGSSGVLPTPGVTMP